MNSDQKGVDSLGENLTIAILSFNRSQLTLNLINSIFQFEPRGKFRILVLDQGSEGFESEKLRYGIQDSRIDYQHLPKNLGVSGGRNWLLSRCETDWILFLDNDLVVMGDFLKILAESTTNSIQFYTLPFCEGGEYLPDTAVKSVLFTEQSSGSVLSDKPFVGLGGVNIQSKIDRKSQKPGIAGGVFLAKKEVLVNLNGFEGPGLVGYEDLELTLRAYSQGIEISHIQNIKPLFHFKGQLESQTDKSNRAERLDPLELRVNATYIETKHNVKVWSMIQYKWILDSFRSAGIESELENRLNSYSSRRARSKIIPRVLLVADVPGWALDRIASQMKEKLRDEFEINITYSQNWNFLVSTLNNCVWDSVIFLWRNPLFQLMRDDSIPVEVISKCHFIVYDHQGWMGFDAEVDSYINANKPVGAVNKKLLSDLASLGLNAFYVPDGVDSKLFYPPRNIRLASKVKVGWAGNTLWGGPDDNKGYKKILSKLIKDLDSKYFEINILDASKGRIPQKSVAQSMRKWDVVLCSSLHEGTPNPVLEGLASGLYVISTKVGMVPELNESGASIEIVTREVSEFIDALIYYKDNQEISLSRRYYNYAASESWDWNHILVNHRKFIRSTLQNVKD